MPTLAIVSSDIKDLYNQEFEQDSTFFRDGHFDRMAAMEYGSLIQQYYNQNYNQNRQETGYGTVDLSQDWLVPEEHELEKDDKGFFVSLNFKPFSFMFDQQTSAIQNIFPLKGNSCGKFARTSVKELYKFDSDIIPTTKINWWYYDMCGQIRFVDMKCKPETVQVYYLPSMGDEPCPDFLIPDGLASQITSNVLRVMLAAKNGNVVDMTNDGNSNRTIQTEISTATLKK